jgi:metal-responsive CopG/Arc/MetJ family transcriptional regulator
MKNTTKPKLESVSVKLDPDRIALMDKIAQNERSDRSQILRWAVEAFLIHQKNTKTVLRPQVMEDLMTEHLRLKGTTDARKKHA